MQARNSDHAGAAGRTVTPGRLIAVEIVVGSVINVMLNLVFSWMTFPIGAPVHLGGWPGLAIDLLPATVVPALMTTFVVTAILRRRLRAGLIVEPAPQTALRLPPALWQRALGVAVLALFLVAAPTLVVLVLLWPVAGSWVQLILFKLLFSVFHAAALTPIVILAELSNRAR